MKETLKRIEISQFPAGQREIMNLLQNLSNDSDITLANGALLNIFIQANQITLAGGCVAPVEILTDVTDTLLSVRDFYDKYKDDKNVPIDELYFPDRLTNTIYWINLILKFLTNTVSEVDRFNTFLQRVGIEVDTPLS